MVRRQFGSQEDSFRAAVLLSLPITDRPLRLDFNDSHLAIVVVPEAAPFPLVRFYHQSAFHRVTVQIAQLHRELFRIANIAIVIPFLPKRSGRASPVTLGKSQFQVVNGVSQAPALWFTHQNVDVLWHHDISVNPDIELETHVFQTVEKEFVGCRMIESWLSAITAERDEVDLSGMVKTSKSVRHTKRLNCAKP